jgi:hypothetical protein
LLLDQILSLLRFQKMANQLVGLSFSFCIQAVLLGKIAEGDVSHIVTSTMARDSHDWANVISSYKEGYWYDDPERAEAIAWRFINENKVIQPRVGDSLGQLEGHIPLSQEGVVQLGQFGENWIDPETKQPHRL